MVDSDPIEGDLPFDVPAADQPTSDPGDVPVEPTPEPVAPTSEPEPAPAPDRQSSVTADQQASQDLNAQLEAATTYAKSLAGSADTAAYDAAVAEVGRLEKLRG